VLADADSNAGIGPITDVFNILGEVGRKRLRPFFVAFAKACFFK